MRTAPHTLLALALGASFLGFACSREPAKITVAPAESDLIGKDLAVTLKATVADAKGKPIPEATLSWRSSDEKVATVDPGGKVTGKTSGVVTVSATSEKVTAEARVKFTFVERILITLPDTGLMGPPGTRVPLAVRAENERRTEIKDAPVTYESSAPNIAEVDKDGVVTLKAPGMVTLRALVGKAKGERTEEVVIQIPRFLRLPNTAVFLRPGETTQLEFEVFDKKGQSLKVFPTFTSGDPAVASVNEKGEVSALAPGTTQILVGSGIESRPIHITVK